MQNIIGIFLLYLLPVMACAQDDFATLDRKSYELYIKNDYRGLKRVARGMLDKGMDYYYLRMRLGILAYNHGRYASATEHFTRALQFNGLDTICREYIYYSYLFSGRRADAYLYLDSIGFEKQNNHLRTIRTYGINRFTMAVTYAAFDTDPVATNSMNYEALSGSSTYNVVLRRIFSAKVAGIFAFAHYRKTGRFYSGDTPTGLSQTYSQNQLYGKLERFFFPGFRLFGYGHVIFFTEEQSGSVGGRRANSSTLRMQSLAGAGLARNWWKIRMSLNASISNFGTSSQQRVESALTILPFGNLNLYSTTTGMLQHDKTWGNTYYFSQVLGAKFFRFVWFEAGFASGNSFLFSFSEGTMVDNSYNTPEFSVFGKIAVVGKKVDFSVSPFWAYYDFYSWDEASATRVNPVQSPSFGATVLLTFK